MTTETIIQHILTNCDGINKKVCIPVKPEIEPKVYSISNDLNSASYYCIIDFQLKSSIIMHLKEIQEIFKQSNGAGFKALNINVLICNEVAPMALKILDDKGIVVLKSEGFSIEQNLHLFLKNQLTDFTSAVALQSTSCSSSCSSCNTACK